MKSMNLKSRAGLVAVVLAIACLAGCSSPAATPVDQRKPGEDISPASRADKRGDVPVNGSSAAGGK